MVTQPEHNTTQAHGPVGQSPTARQPILHRYQAGALPPHASSAAVTRSPVLFVGRPSTVNALAALLEGWPTAGGNGPDTNAADEESAPLVLAVTSQKAALAALRLMPPRVVLVEVDANNSSRIRFCEMIRYRLPTALIYAVAAQPPATPFGFDGVLSVPLIAAQVYAALASAQAEAAGHIVQRGPIRLNTATRTVITPNGRHHMTPKQCALLHTLLLNAGQVVSRRRLMADVWETSYLEDTRTLDVHIRWLRERIEPDPSAPVYLLTVRGEGYLLRVG